MLPPERRRSACVLAALRGLVVALIIFALAPRSAAAQTVARATSNAALAALLDEVRVSVPAICTGTGVDRLVHVLCARTIRVGVRSNYPQFGLSDGDTLHGYEIDLARVMAARLGVAIELVAVTPANRIALLAEERIDVAIASMGHNTQRDSQALFVRPHYYQSETILVAPRAVQLSGWNDVAGRTVCVTAGNGSNSELSARGGRLMLFDSPRQLLDQLQSGSCSVVAQDDSFFAEKFATLGFAAAYERKLAFAPVPWGMAVAHDGSAQLAHALGLILQTLHRDGELIDLARANKIDAGFLEAQQEVWTRPACQNPNFAGAIGCILPPLNIDVQRTRFASSVETVEVWLATRFGVHMSLPMFTSAAAWTLLCNGVVNSLLLVVGTLVATLACALMLAIVLDMPWRLPRLAAWLLGITLRSSPIVLTLVIAQALASALVPYSAAVALIASILTLGLVNGAYAAQAIAEAAHTLRADPRMTGISGLALFRRAVQRSAKQIESFLVNATKGTPAASFIGAPELLNALTDISSFSSERMTTYSLLLVFYTVVVMGVVRVGRWLRRATDLGRLPA